MNFAHGILHGAVWYFVYRQHVYARHFQWQIIHDALPDNLPALHGVGHGLVIIHALRHDPTVVYDHCSHPPSNLSISVFNNSVSDCLRAPDTVSANWCASGVYHAMVEHGEAFATARSSMQPCDLLPLSNRCFEWLFSYGHALKQFIMGPNCLISFCSTVRSEANRRGCIWGMSHNFFSAFHRGWGIASRGRINNSLAYAACEQMPFGGPAAKREYCGLLFQPSHTKYKVVSQSSLVDWCRSLVIGKTYPVYMRRHNWLEWLACLHGAATGAAHIFRSQGMPQRTLDMECQHDLAWQQNDLWTRMTIVCSSFWSAQQDFTSGSPYRDKKMVPIEPFFERTVFDLLL
jgi:hypothetical protein